MVWLGIEEIGLLLLKENKIFNAASLGLVSSVSVCVCTVTKKPFSMRKIGANLIKNIDLQ